MVPIFHCASRVTLALLLATCAIQNSVTGGATYLPFPKELFNGTIPADVILGKDPVRICSASYNISRDSRVAVSHQQRSAVKSLETGSAC